MIVWPLLGRCSARFAPKAAPSPRVHRHPRCATCAPHSPPHLRPSAATANRLPSPRRCAYLVPPVPPQAHSYQRSGAAAGPPLSFAATTSCCGLSALRALSGYSVDLGAGEPSPALCDSSLVIRSGRRLSARRAQVRALACGWRLGQWTAQRW